MVRKNNPCQEFVRLVEELLAKRRAQYKSKQHIPEFTRDELTETAYSSYRDLYFGRIVNPPKRTVVMAIADYLEATLKERNRLLVAAGYVPEQTPLEGRELEAALAIANRVISYWPFPSYIMTRDWTIQGWNQLVLKLFDLAEEEIAVLPLEKRHVLYLIFDLDLPIYHRLNGNHETWAYTAKLNLYGFKQTNMLCVNDAWYKRLITNLMKLPDFAQFWHEVEIDRSIVLDPIGKHPFPTYSTEITTHGRSVWVFGLHTSLGNFDFPLIVSYLPYRDVDRQTFLELGLPTPENGWIFGVG
jgi:hypothetical protein